VNSLMPMQLTGISSDIENVATHIAMKSGEWNDPDIWDGSVPGAGAIVHIPSGISVSHRSSAAAEAFYVHVDGDLLIASTSGPVSFTVDTLIGTHGSSISIDGTSGQLIDIKIEATDFANTPSLSAYAEREVFEDGVQIDDGTGVLGRFEWDPDQISLGIVSAGKVNIKGAQKAGHLDLRMTADAGSNVLELAVADSPDQNDSNLGWAIGDQLAIGSTTYFDYNSAETLTTEDEFASIVSVNRYNDTLFVEIDKPLAHSHIVKTLDADGDGTEEVTIAGSVANLTRSVQIHSPVATKTNDFGIVVAQTNGTSATGELGDASHFVTERGHTMFMHNPDVEVSHALFAGLGRTDKTRQIDDFDLKDNHGRNNNVVVFDEEITNQRGRYAVHLHQNGFGGDEDKNPDDAFDYEGVYLDGIVAWGSPGWGIAHHGGEAVLSDNVAIGIKGSGFVSETGNETGAWHNNLAMQIVGPDADERDAIIAANQGNISQLHDQVRGRNQDFGAYGTGYWLESRILDVAGNKAQGTASAGFQIGGNGVDSVGTLANTLANGEYLDRDRFTDGIVAARDIPLTVFDQNTAINTMTGVWMDDFQTFRPDGAVEHDIRSLITNFTASDVERSGVFLRNTSQVTVNDSITAGVIPLGGTSTGQSFAFGAYQSTVDTVYNRGWTTGTDQSTAGKILVADPINANKNGDSAAVFIDVVQDNETPQPLFNSATTFVTTPRGETAAFDLFHYQSSKVNLDIHDVPGWAAAPTQVLTSGQLAPGRFTVILGDKSTAQAYTIAGGGTEYLTPNQQGSTSILIGEHIEEIREVSETYIFDTDIVAANAAANTKVVGIWGVKIDAIGATYAPFNDLADNVYQRGMDPDGLIKTYTVAHLDHYIEKNGLIEINSELFALVNEGFSDRISTDVYEVDFLVRLNGAKWSVQSPDKVFSAAQFGAAKDTSGAISFSLGGRNYSEHDMLTASESGDLLFGQFGDDLLLGGSDDDWLRGNSGADTLRGDDGDDSLSGGAGEDSLFGGSDDDTVDGGSGSDTLFGDAGMDVLSGEDGSDKLFGGADNDELNGGDSADTLQGQAGNDMLDGGSGDDKGYGGSGDDVIGGGGGNDALFGDLGNDTIRGDDGNDRIFGGQNDDAIYGDMGRDTLGGGDGNDRLEGGPGDGKFYGDAGNDTIIGAEDKDVATAGSGDDLIQTFGGNDRINGQAGLDTLDGGEGNDQLNGGADDDRIIGGSGNDRSIGGGGDDYVDAGTGNDTLFGGEGDDTLLGGNGNDRLEGDVGSDVMTGGAGRDTFILSHHGAVSAGDMDIITDLDFSEDTLIFSPFAGNSGVTIQDSESLFDLEMTGLTIEDTGDDTVLTFDDAGNTRSVTLEGIDPLMIG